MRKRFIYGLLTLSFAACSKEEAPAAPEPAAEAPPAPEPAAPAFDAKTTFATVCATCHGPTGGGDGPAGAALDPKPAAFSSAAFWENGPDRAEIVKVITEGGPAAGKSPLMAPYGGQYTEEQIGELADLVMGFKPE